MKTVFKTFLKTLLFFSLPLSMASAQMIAFSFFQKSDFTLKFSTAAQTVLSKVCSGVVTVQTYRNYGSTLTAVTSNLTVNLSGTGGLTFYTDPSCTLPITSITIPSAANSASFYFVDTSTGTDTITALAAGYTSATQSETLNTNSYVWTGGGGNANWSTAGNWSGGAAPGASNVAVFDGSCSSNCSPTVDVSISVKGVVMASSYVGTITQGSGNTITVGASGWSQRGGIFVGNNADLTFNTFAINGGSFQSTSTNFNIGAVLAPNTNATYTMVVGSTGTFTHNNGKLIFNGTARGNCSAQRAADVYLYQDVNLYDLEIAPKQNLYGCTTNASFDYSNINLGGANIFIVNNNLTHSDGQVFGNNISLKKNLIVTCASTAIGGACAQGGSSTVVFNGSGAQYYSGDLNSQPPLISVQKPNGTILSENGGGSFWAQAVDIQSGTFKAPAGTLKLARNNATSGSITNLGVSGTGVFDHNSGTVEFASWGTSNSQGQLTTSTGSITFYNLNVNVNKTSGDLAGNVSFAGSDVYVQNTFTGKDGGISWGGIHFLGNVILNCDNPASPVVCFSGGNGSTLVVKFEGSAAQTVDATQMGSSVIPFSGHWFINKTNATDTVTFLSNFNMSMPSSQYFHVLTGVFAVGTHQFSLTGTTHIDGAALTTMSCGGGVGSITFNGVAQTCN